MILNILFIAVAIINLISIMFYGHLLNDETNFEKIHHYENQMNHCETMIWIIIVLMYIKMYM